MNEELGRRLPVSIESEQAVLGSILIRPDSFEEIAGLLDSEDFSLDEHKKIYATMRSMSEMVYSRLFRVRLSSWFISAPESLTR